MNESELNEWIKVDLMINESEYTNEREYTNENESNKLS